MLLVLVLAAPGCGSESSTGAEGTGTGDEPERLYPRVKGPGREFLIPGGDNIVQFFGEEATPAEREKASRVAHVWMRARVAQDWAADCKYLARGYREGLVKDARGVTGGKVRNCRAALDYFGTNASGKLVNTLTGPIDSLRVRDSVTDFTEKEAYAQYHGRQGIDWVLPMVLEKGEWKVSSASPLERTK